MRQRKPNSTITIRFQYIRTEMAYLWTTIEYLTAALLLSYAFWAYTEGEDPGIYQKQ